MPEPNYDLRLEIAHVLFIDIVGSSKLLINEQSQSLRQLNELVRGSAQVRAAEEAGKLIRLPTGDGMALAFFTTPDAPVRCALELSQRLKEYPNLPVRMGIHSGPVEEVVDVNERANIAGAGITIAQRVMDCGDAGHILLSKRVADDLGHYSQWRPYLHDLGECEVKHGERVGVVNFYAGDVGNPALPEKLKQSVNERNPAPLGSRHRKVAGVAALLALLVVTAGAIWFAVHRSEKRVAQSGLENPAATTATTPFGKRIAVLPFKPLVANANDEVLELGMADSLITKLSNSRELIVSSLPSVRKYRGLDQDPVAAGRQLGVNSVLEGNVQKSGDHIRVTARLIKVADGSALWAGQFDKKFTDVFAVQDAISQEVADALAVQLSRDEQSRLIRRYTDNIEAYQLYMQGRYQWSKLTPSNIRTSIDFFQRAIDLDPNYALAYFGLAEADRSLAINADVPSKDCLPQAKAAAERALRIDNSLAEAHASLSFSLIWYDWDWAGAEREARRAIALNPNSAHSHFAYAHVLSDLGRHDEALSQIGRAIELDPVFLLYRALQGMFFLNAGRTQEAMVKLQATVELDPRFWVTHLMLGRGYIQQKKYPEAIAELSEARDLSHGNSEAIGTIGYAAAISGDSTKARVMLDELKTVPPGRYVPPCNIALVYAGLGDREQAFSFLERACDERDVRVTLLKVDPRWDLLRSDPRFQAILKRIGLK
jgi:TolB-like protein/Flp pilus assembly protein TadD/class 3 adenylate cyclase